MKIVFASHSFIGGTFVVGSHHLARELVRLGHEVLHVATPVSPLHLLLPRGEDGRRRRRLCLSGVHETPGGARQWVPLSWVRGRALGRDLALPTVLPAVRGVLRRAGFHRADLLLIDQPTYAGLWNYLDVNRIVYRPTDLCRQFDPRRDMARCEQAVLDRVDAAVATSEPVAEHVRRSSRPGLPVHVLENGVDFAKFSSPTGPPPEYADIPAPRAVYVGAFDGRFDWAAVRAAATALPGVNFVLIGPRPAAGADGLPANVQVLGPRPYDRVPAYLRHASVGLLPLSGHGANVGRSPMKLYEYTAAGLPVVARRTPELERRGLKTLSLYEEPAALPARLVEAIETRHDRDATAEAAREFDWPRRAELLLEQLGYSSPAAAAATRGAVGRPVPLSSVRSGTS